MNGVSPIDPTGQGEADRWFAPDLDDRRWDRVEVPHCWPLDPRYQYTGRAWYRRTFPTPEALGDGHARIEFGAVFARARVWLNGTPLGAHEGGYTPFGFDVTRALAAGQPNVLVLEVDNSWSTTTMPGARPGTEPTARVYPWWDYGGIIRPVTLVVSPAVYVQKQRVTAVPDLTAGTAAIEATTWVRNTTTRPAISRLRLTLVRLDGDREVSLTVPAATLEGTGTTAAGATMPITLRATLPREVVRLWGLDHPTLYRVRTELTTESGVDLHASTFGIRRFEARGTELQLNGRPVRLGGANRPSDDPKFGLLEPIEVVERDVKLMKAAGMELQRIIHYAPPPALLDLSDRLGLLIVGEPGNWNLQPTQLEDAGMRADFENQMRELVERDWNHPSVIAWSVGNEYASDTPAGVRWTKDMVAFVASSIHHDWSRLPAIGPSDPTCRARKTRARTWSTSSASTRMPRPRGWERCSIWSTSGIHRSLLSSASSDFGPTRPRVTTTGDDIFVRRLTSFVNVHSLPEHRSGRSRIIEAGIRTPRRTAIDHGAW